MKKLILAISILSAVVFGTELKAQKFGYVNSQELLLAMPETKKMDTMMAKKIRGVPITSTKNVSRISVKSR